MPFHQEIPIILASTSPRRRELLKKIRPHFEIEPPSLKMESLDDNLSIEQALQKLALEKAKSVSKKFPKALVIGADTVVVLDNQVLGKPADAEAAKETLKALAGKSHEVLTAFALCYGKNVLTAYEKSIVTFKPLSDEVIEQYIATGEPFDKAGAYGIQGKGKALVETYSGDLDNIIGLPLQRLNTEINNFLEKNVFPEGHFLEDGIKLSERPPELRPRERLLHDSASSLNNAELLAILLQAGTKEMDVLELSNKILSVFDGWAGLLNANKEQLCQIHGIGESKACIILAAVELGRRLSYAKNAYKQPVIKSSMDAAEVFRNSMRNNDQETFHVLYLNVKHVVIEEKELFIGTANQTLVHTRDIFRDAVRNNAHALIVGHNHPSGDVSPSQQDIEMTKHIAKAGQLMGIELLDHIIIGKLYQNDFTSLKESGYIK